MIPNALSNQKVALLAIRKLANELGGDSHVRRPAKCHVFAIDDDNQSRLIDLSACVDSIRDRNESTRNMIEQLKAILAQLGLIIWSCIGKRRTGQRDDQKVFTT